jgi:hypothetical protein
MRADNLYGTSPDLFSIQHAATDGLAVTRPATGERWQSAIDLYCNAWRD